MPERRDESIHIEYLPLSALLKAPRNPKDHDIGLLHDSFSRFGFVEPIAINETTGRLVAGHGRLEALQEAKAEGDLPPKRIEVRDGDWFVPVLRGIAFDSDEEAEAYLVVSNQATAAGGWDEEALAELLREHTGNLRGTGFSEADVADLLLKVANANETQHDEPALGHLADLQTKWSTSPGKLWRIGPHRLVCGDATDPAVVEALFEKEQPEMLVTDPPYGVEYDPEWRFKIAARSKDPTSLGRVVNDDRANWASVFAASGVRGRLRLACRRARGRNRPGARRGRFRAALPNHLAQAAFRDQPRPLSLATRAVLVRRQERTERPMGRRPHANKRVGYLGAGRLWPERRARRWADRA